METPNMSLWKTSFLETISKFPQKLCKLMMGPVFALIFKSNFK